MDLGEGSEAGVSVTEELFGVRKGALDGFLSSRMEALAPVGQAMGVDPLAGIGPDVAGDGALSLGIGGAGGQKRASPADRGIGFLMEVAAPICGGVSQHLALRAAVAIGGLIIDEL